MAETTLASPTTRSVRDTHGSFRIFLNRLFMYRPGFYSLVILIILYLFAFIGPFFMRWSPNELDLTNMLAGPSIHHLLGTDENGRDVFARLVYGGRISLVVGLFAVLEHTIGALFHGKGFAGGFRELMNEGKYELLARCLLTFFAFIPFFAFRELARVMGEGKLRALFFRRHEHIR